MTSDTALPPELKQVTGFSQPAPQEVDMRAVCETLGFDPTNHHNAAKCPYCRQQSQPAPQGVAEVMQKLETVAWRDNGSYRCTAKQRPDWLNPAQLVYRSDVEQAIAALITERDALRAGVVTLRAKVEELPRHRWDVRSPDMLYRADVLALIDKMGGTV